MEYNRKPKGIAPLVRELVTPTADEQGLTLWDVEYVREGTEMILRLTIDKTGGVTIDDCEKFHRAIDPLLDEADPIENAYRLEVSSPGIERVLTRPEHFDAMAGSEVEVKLFAPIDGVKLFRATLGGLEDGSVVLTVGDETVKIEREKIARIHTVFDFGAAK